MPKTHHLPTSSHLRLYELLRDGRWHPIFQMVRVMRSYRVSSAVYRLRKLGFIINWQRCKRGTEYKLCQ